MLRLSPSIRSIASGAIAFLCLSRALAGDPLVTIAVTQPSGTFAFGSGFVATSDGAVFTCYHVVEGATHIRVFYHHAAYEARATAISPSRDIAKLQMQGKPAPFTEPTDYLPLRFSLKPATSAETLRVCGYAAGLFGQRVPAIPTQDDFALTQQMTDTDGKRLFDSRDVKILPIVTTIYKGMSGAPLVGSDGSVLGLVSGSLTQGGSIAWAIAAENCKAENLDPVDAPSAGFVWPPLTLMHAGWANLRRQTGIGEDLAMQIDHIAATAISIEAEALAVTSRIRSVLSGFDGVKKILDEYALDDVLTTNLSQVPGGIEFKNKYTAAMSDVVPLADDALERLTTLSADRKQLEKDYTAAFEVTGRILKDLPPTSKNNKLAIKLDSRLVESEFAFVQINSAMANITKDFETLKVGKLVKVADYRSTIDKEYVRWLGFERINSQLLPKKLVVYKTAADIFHEILAADVGPAAQ